MIPTAFSVASAIYCEIGDQPSDEFVNCPNAIPALRQVSVQSIMYIPRGVTSMHHPLGGHLPRRYVEAWRGVAKMQRLLPRATKKNARPTWK